MHLLGISMGGRIAGMYAATYPKDLTSVILVCPHGIKNKLQTMFAEQFKQTKKFALLPDTADEYINMINMAVHKPIKVPHLMAEGSMQIRNSKLPIYTRVAENMLDYDDMFERNLENITTPVFLIWGNEDKIIDVSCVDVIKSKLPNTLKKEFKALTLSIISLYGTWYTKIWYSNFASCSWFFIFKRIVFSIIEISS